MHCTSCAVSQQEELPAERSAVSVQEERRQQSLTASQPRSKNTEGGKKKSRGPRADLHGHPLPGPAEVQVCRRHWSRILAFSPPLGGGIQVLLPSQGRDGLLRGSPPSSVGVHRDSSPVWWISCSTLLSWMIWGIIQKVSFSSFNHVFRTCF